MRLSLRALAALLGYPSAEMKENIAAIRGALIEERALPTTPLRLLTPLLDGIEREDLLDLQIDYSELFDRSRKLSLHLFEHVHGDNRERGQAMIDLGQQYLEAGIFLETSELPDFVPVFLEYCSCLDQGVARATLSQPAHVFAALAERLDARASPYAAIFHAILSLSGARPDKNALAELNERVAGEEAMSVDEQWEEAPVSFMGNQAHEMGGPTGAVAKIRAANRPIGKQIKA